MKKSKSTYSWFLIAALLSLFFGCKSKTVCPEDIKTTKADIVSVSGPQNMHKGEQATITVGIRNHLKSFCVKEANAYLTNIGLDSLLVTAELSYTDDPVPAGCDCRTDTVLYTLIYFTPLNEGSYRIVTDKDSSATNIQPGSASDIVINVD